MENIFKDSDLISKLSFEFTHLPEVSMDYDYCLNISAIIIAFTDRYPELDKSCLIFKGISRLGVKNYKRVNLFLSAISKLLILYTLILDTKS